MDKETGNYYYGARYYDPKMSIFISVDPLADHPNKVDKSPYSAFWNIPIKYIDPDGRCPDCPDPTFGFGLSFESGDFTGLYGLGVTYHSDFFSKGKSGLEFRNFLMLNYNDGTTGGSLGTIFWSGTGGLKEFGQQTGMLSFSSGDFSFSYENDGTPFQYIGLGDGGDSYRTAAASVGVGDFSLNMNLVTGLRNQHSYDIERASPGGEKGILQGTGQFGETYKHGFVFEQGTNYHYGGLTLNYGGISGGVNSEWVRHSFQNVLAHDIIQPQRQFPMLSNDGKPVLNLSNQGTSKFTIWRQ